MNNAATIVKRVRDRMRQRMDLRLNEESFLVSMKAQSLLRKAEAVKATRASKLDVQKTAEKEDFKPWYFTHF